MLYYCETQALVFSLTLNRPPKVYVGPGEDAAWALHRTEPGCIWRSGSLGVRPCFLHLPSESGLEGPRAVGGAVGVTVEPQARAPALSPVCTLLLSSRPQGSLVTCA